MLNKGLFGLKFTKLFNDFHFNFITWPVGIASEAQNSPFTTKRGLFCDLFKQNKTNLLRPNCNLPRIPVS